MSIKTKVLAAAATLTVAGGLSTAGTLPAGAATPQCGQACIQIFSAKFGTYANPGFIESVFLGIPAAGVPTILHRAKQLRPGRRLHRPPGGPGIDVLRGRDGIRRGERSLRQRDRGAGGVRAVR